MTYDLTKGSILKSIVFFSIPLIIGNLLQQLYNVADTVIVGRYLGPKALASVGSSFTLIVFITSIILGLCMGAGAYLSMAFGSKNYKTLKNAIFHSFILIAIITAIINCFAIIFIDKILLLLNIPEDIWQGTKDYTLIILIGIIATFLYNFYSNVLKSIGNSLTPVIVIAISSIINIILDIIFIVSFQWGVRGAAIATVISQYIGGISLIIYTYLRYPLLRIKKEDIYYNGGILKNILNLSLLTSVQQSIMSFGILMVQGLVNSFGTQVIAGFSAAVKIEAFSYMPVQDFGNAYSTFIAQNFGAKKQDRIRKSIPIIIKFILIFCSLISLIVFFNANKLMGLFVNIENLEVIKIGVKYLKMVSPFYFGIGLLFMFYGFYRGMNNPKVSILLTIISLGLRVVLAYTLSKIPKFGVLGIWIAIPIGWIIADITGFIILNKKIRGIK